MHRIGVGLIIASFVVWVVPLIAPFFPFSTAAKASIVTVAIVAAEIMFWIGGLLVSKEAAAKLKEYWHPKHWRIKRRLSDQTNDGEQCQDGLREMTTMKK
ncbi:transporter suffix domain-containing protein [Geobacillus sp. BMUD]|uniref:transporter suffix domain-containing protein n=1 Tax=Geobacillus TaxID=129337 RepID=UPI0004DF51DE|nr:MULTISPECIES: transporter suffix domain-containing protein [Geobacillus]NNU85430.1 transporter suffix domain-containing protein [Geobacillus sp. BMUD]